MALLLRKIEDKANWYKDSELTRDLPKGELPADILGDLKTKDNALSVWQVEANGSNLERVVAAILASKQTIQKFDYLLVEKQVVEESGFEIAQVKGRSPDEEAAKLWHFDIRRLSVSALGRLAGILYNSGHCGRKLESDLTSCLRDSISKGHVSPSELHQDMQNRLDR